MTNGNDPILPSPLRFIIEIQDWGKERVVEMEALGATYVLHTVVLPGWPTGNPDELCP
jgi:hypothetical protein